MKQYLIALLTKDHVESLIRSGLKLVSGGLIALGTSQNNPHLTELGAALGATGLVTSLINVVEGGQDSAQPKPTAVAPKIVNTALLFLLGLSLFFTGCTVTQQKAAYNTLWSIEVTADNTYHAYVNQVALGNLRTNDVPQVTHLFNQLQAGVLLAESAVQFNTNAIAPASLVQESADFMNLINVINQKTKPTN